MDYRIRIPARGRHFVPWALTLSRFALGPGMLAAAHAPAASRLSLSLLIAALLSDIFDGVLARRWQTVTPALRVTDSWADVAFYSCVAGAIALRYPSLVSSLREPLTITLAFYPLRWVQDWTKYRRLASYHATLSRISGALLFAACTATFCAFHPAVFFWCAFAVGVACHLEAIAITAVLPRWTHDVSGLKAALRLQKASSTPARLTG